MTIWMKAIGENADRSGWTPGMLKMTEETFQALRRHGEETYPDECCGVLLGKASGQGNLVQATAPAGNMRTDSAHNRYQIAPQELLKIQHEARAKGLDIVGFYHSHPDHPALWSATDFREAHWLGCSYVITSVVAGAARQTNSFLLTGSSEDDKKLDDESIQVSPTLAGC